MATSLCSVCGHDFARFQVASTLYCDSCPAPAGPQRKTQAPNRSPTETWDYYAARYFVCLLVRFIMRKDGVTAKPKWAWYTSVFMALRQLLPQLMYQTDFPALFKIVRLGIRTVSEGAADYVYPKLRKNELWLQTVNVDFNPLPSRIYQSMWVSGKAGEDFVPRFTPEHCYRCKIVMKGKRLKEFLVNPHLVCAERPPKRTCVLANYPRKRPRLAEEEEDSVHEVYVTINSNSLKPPLQAGAPYLLDQISVDPELLRNFQCLRLDRKKLEREERPEYLEYISALQVHSSQACRMVLAFARELNLETLDSEWPPGLTFRDFYEELSVTLKRKLCTMVLNQTPVCELHSPSVEASGSALVVKTHDLPLQIHTLYVVELKAAQSQLLCGVTQLQEDNKLVLALSRKHLSDPDLHAERLACWEVTSLLAPIQELAALLSR